MIHIWWTLSHQRRLIYLVCGWCSWGKEHYMFSSQVGHPRGNTDGAWMHTPYPAVRPSNHTISCFWHGVLHLESIKLFIWTWAGQSSDWSMAFSHPHETQQADVQQTDWKPKRLAIEMEILGRPCPGSSSIVRESSSRSSTSLRRWMRLLRCVGLHDILWHVYYFIQDTNKY